MAVLHEWAGYRLHAHPRECRLVEDPSRLLRLPRLERRLGFLGVAKWGGGDKWGGSVEACTKGALKVHERCTSRPPPLFIAPPIKQRPRLLARQGG